MAMEKKAGGGPIRITAGARVLRPVGQIIPKQHSARIHPKEQVERLRESLRTFGFVRPLLIDGDGRLLAGGGVLQAALAEGMDVVPCILAEGLSEEQKRGYILADDRLAEMSTWDRDLVALELEELDALGFDLDVTGFTLEDMDLRPEPEEDGYVLPDDIPALTAGRCYRLGRHRLYVGDATAPGALDMLMDGAQAELLLTDPPYNVDYLGRSQRKPKQSKRRGSAGPIENDNWPSEAEFEDFLTRAFACCAQHMAPGGAFYIWYAANHSVSAYRACERGGLDIRQQLIWTKDSFVLGRQDYHWQHEPCLYGWKPGAAHRWAGDRRQGTVLQFERPVRSEEHPTMKPVKLFDYLVRNSSRPGDIVLDPFAGSGTTLIACEQDGRSAYLAEIDPRYGAVIVDRWRKLTGEDAKAA